MVERIHFSKFIALIAVFATACSISMSASAENDNEALDGGRSHEISKLAQEGLDIMRQVEKGDLTMFPDLNEIPTEPLSSEIKPEFLLQQAPEWLKKQTDLAKKSEKELIYLFASRAMPELELVEMMREASGRPEVHVVFRGIYPDENYRTAFKDIHRIIEKANLDSPPNVLINPVVFRKFGVKEAPEIVYAQGDKDLIRAQGTFSVDWLLKEYRENGRTGDIGSYGTVNVVTEMDLVELMKQRLAKLDLAKKKQTIIDTYWQDKTFVQIRKATKNSRRKVDPSVTVHENVYAPDGTIIAKAGTRMNPLFFMPFTYKIIVFDARDDEQVEFVANKLREYPETQLVQLIASHIMAEKGWKHLNELDDQLGHPVYILNKDVQQRFGITNVPTIIDADDRYFYIEEFSVPVHTASTAVQ